MRYGFAALLLLVGQTAIAHDIITTNLTYARDISRILARHCVSCHAANSSIPLTTYEEVRPWAVAMKEQVLRRFMPPWGAVKGFGDLSPDQGLSQEDMMLIAAWVVGGAPKGNIGLLPVLKPQLSVNTAGDPSLRDQLIIHTRQRLSGEMHVTAIRPIAEKRVPSARVVAKLPDGRVEPLVWLFQYDPKFAHSFTFRKVLILPAGTVVESSEAMQFALQTTATVPSPAR